MPIGLAAHIKMLPDRNSWFQGCYGLRQGATRTAISSQNATSLNPFKPSVSRIY